MSKKKEHIIDQVARGSIAEELDIEAGDYLLRIDDKEIEDIFDYQYFCESTNLVLLVRKKNGEEWELEIEKDEDEDLGLIFNNGLMSEYKSCRNQCMFCFIDQMPPNMRPTLYFKDDDSRLSFLQGNYVTLTNMSERDIDRIIEYRLSPINISFHTTNPTLRCKMLNNRFAGDIFPMVQRLFEANILMNGQIVLCKGVNDGAELERSIEDLAQYIPALQSVSVVPVGLTKYREGLYPLQPFQKEDAIEVLKLVHAWQQKLYHQYGTHFIHAGDEWYALADWDVPPESMYDGYLQLENGVGMVRLFIDELKEAVAGLTYDEKAIELSIATGALAAPLMKQAAAEIGTKYPNLKVNVYTIINEFFGELITVAGLLTGQDILKQLTGKPLGDKLLLSSHVLRMGEQVFLDDMTVEQLEEELHVKIEITGSSGQDLVEAITGGK